MTSPVLETAWLEAQARFARLKEFVSASAAAGLRDTDYRGALYTSWVLLGYAHTEAGMRDLAKAGMAVLGATARVPDELPGPLVREHRRRSLEYLADKSGEPQDPEFVRRLKLLDNVGWHEVSRLLHFDTNVWPHQVHNWFVRRLGGRDDQVRWMNEPIETSSETLASRVKNLVAERNRLAHGGDPDNLLTAPLMNEWIDQAQNFVKLCSRMVQCHLTDLLALPATAIGMVDTQISLGHQTVAFSRLDAPLQIGDHLLLRSDVATTRSCEVTSIFSDDTSLERVSANAERVAVSVTRRLRGASLCLPL